jgi:hypothetical protein
MNHLYFSVYSSLTPTHTFATAPELVILVVPGWPEWRNLTLDATMAYIRKITAEHGLILTYVLDEPSQFELM